MDRFEPRTVDVRIKLRRRDIRVAQHLLDDPQVSAMLEKMRSKTVAQRMRSYLFLDAR